MSDDSPEDYGVGSFSKLFASIVTSTIWREADHVRIVWVTMLAICDKRGVVLAAVPGLAAVANVSIEHCLEAIDKLLSPDPWSRTKEFDGRRIEVIRGGWRLLNYAHYRDSRGERSNEPSDTPDAIRKRRQRERERLDDRDIERDIERDTVTPTDAGGTLSASASASASGVLSEKQEQQDSRIGERPPERVTRFIREHNFGRFQDQVEGYLRASRKPLAIVAELELWLAGELNRKKTDPETLAEALNAYDAATERGEFKTNHFAGFVRGVHRGRDRNENNRRNSAEDRSIREEQRATEEREQEANDRARVVEFQQTHPERYLELVDAAKAETSKLGKMPAFQRDTLFNDKLVEMVRREANP